MDRTARLWDLNAARPETSARVLRGHGGMVRALSISPDGRWLVSSSLVNRLDVNGRPDTTAHLWDMRLANAEATPHELIGHDAGVTAAMLTADGHRVITGSDGGRVRLWDVTAEDPAANPLVLRGPERGIQHLALSADGRWVVALSVDASARVWDLRAPQPSATPLLLQAGTALDFSPDSHWLLTAGGDVGYVSSLASDNPAATSTALPKLSFLNGPPAQVFSADSRWLAVGTQDRGCTSDRSRVVRAYCPYRRRRWRRDLHAGDQPGRALADHQPEEPQRRDPFVESHGAGHLVGPCHPRR